MAQTHVVTRTPLQRVRAPEGIAALGSLALSAAVHVQQSLPNNDGVFYILSAEAFERGGLRAAASLHPWPFYPAAIAVVSTVTGLSMEAAAHVAGSLLLAAVCALFVAVVREMGSDPRVAWWAVPVALCHPWLNRTRALIVRDEGAWAFGLLALLLLLRSDRGRRLGALAGWALCGFLAVLFRPETVVLMAAGPVAVALASDLEPRARRGRAALLCLPAVLVATAAVAWLGREPARYRDLLTLDGLTNAWSGLAASFPLPYGREYAPFILVSGLLLVPFVKTLKALGVAHFGLATIGAGTGLLEDSFRRAALVATLLASIAPLYVQLFRLLFVESRYTVLATLVLSIPAPFALAFLLASGAPPRRRLAGLVALVALLATATSSFPLRTQSEDQILSAANWIRGHAPGATLHTSSLQLAYRSGARVDWNAVQQAQMNGRPGVVVAAPGDLWSVMTPPGGPPIPHAASGFRLVVSFPDHGGDTLALYRCEAAACRAERP